HGDVDLSSCNGRTEDGVVDGHLCSMSGGRAGLWRIRVCYEGKSAGQGGRVCCLLRRSSSAIQHTHVDSECNERNHHYEKNGHKHENEAFFFILNVALHTFCS